MPFGIRERSETSQITYWSASSSKEGGGNGGGWEKEGKGTDKTPHHRHIISWSVGVFGGRGRRIAILEILKSQCKKKGIMGKISNGCMQFFGRTATACISGFFFSSRSIPFVSQKYKFYNKDASFGPHLVSESWRTERLLFFLSVLFCSLAIYLKALSIEHSLTHSTSSLSPTGSLKGR